MWKYRIARLSIEFRPKGVMVHDNWRMQRQIDCPREVKQMFRPSGFYRHVQTLESRILQTNMSFKRLGRPLDHFMCDRWSVWISNCIEFIGIIDSLMLSIWFISCKHYRFQRTSDETRRLSWILRVQKGRKSWKSHKHRLRKLKVVTSGCLE